MATVPSCIEAALGEKAARDSSSTSFSLSSSLIILVPIVILIFG